VTGDLSRANLARQIQEENQSLKREVAQLKEEFVRYRHYVRALEELFVERAGINSESDLLTFLGHITASAIYSTHAMDGSLLLVDEDSAELVFVQVRGSVSATLPGYRLKMNEGISGWVATHAAAEIVNDPYRDLRFESRVDQYFKFVTHNLVAVPIQGTKQVLGVLEVLNKMESKEFTAHDLDMMSVLAHVAAPAIESMEMSDSIR
jgi:signal transduction protein with GAF and PtsI domain